ncbi:COMM domain-containing protein 8-like [Argonauta hians]
MADVQINPHPDLWNLVLKAKLPLFKSLLHGVISQLHKDSRNILQYDDYCNVWNMQQYWEVCDGCTQMVLNAGKESWTKDQLFSSMGESVPEQYKQGVYDVIDCRREDIEQQLLAMTHNISERELYDFDWKVKLVMSSDKLGTIHEPLCQLDLDTRDGEKKVSTMLELNSGELKSLIKSLESANKTMLQNTS